MRKEDKNLAHSKKTTKNDEEESIIKFSYDTCAHWFSKTEFRKIIMSSNVWG